MSKFDINFDPQTIPHGLYNIYWKDNGGVSLAAVGSDSSGKRWLAPTNWVSGSTFDWSRVSAVERVDVPFHSENIVLTRTKENGEWNSYSISPNAAYNRQIINAAIERLQAL